MFPVVTKTLIYIYIYIGIFPGTILRRSVKLHDKAMLYSIILMMTIQDIFMVTREITKIYKTRDTFPF